MFHKLHPDAVIPTRKTEKSAGYDLYCIERVQITPYDWAQMGPVLVRTGISVDVPEGYCGMIYSKSSRGIQGIIVGHADLIDGDYKDEIKVLMSNLGPEPVIFVPGGKAIAQIVFVPCYMEDVVDAVRVGGFGSTDTEAVAKVEKMLANPFYGNKVPNCGI